MGAPSNEELALMLSEGLDLCIRGRRMDESIQAALVAGHYGEAAAEAMYETRCLTPALWVQEQYDRDLKAWEDRVKSTLGRMPRFSYGPSAKPEGE